MTDLETFRSLFLPAIERQLQDVVRRVEQSDEHGSSNPFLAQAHRMVAYQMGWEGPGAGPEVQGKRIRPFLVLLTASACGGQWTHALPAAAAVELLHNFSLMHDDIEDNSDLRRGRSTVWKLWGIPLTINAGDALFTLANLSIFDIRDPAICTQAARILLETGLHLTQGQHLDISYENEQYLSEADYWPMIRGKTAALLGACTELGALTGGADSQNREYYRLFGTYLGLAFQVYDDYLGIWGEPAMTGKSVAIDLVSGKKSLPVLYGLGKQGFFAERWRQGPIGPEAVPDLAAQLAAEGALNYVQSVASELTAKAIDNLNQANPLGDSGRALYELASQLLNRNK
jgi:geranylgeranyl diphosphate synthase, type I